MWNPVAECESATSPRSLGNGKAHDDDATAQSVDLRGYGGGAALQAAATNVAVITTPTSAARFLVARVPTIFASRVFAHMSV